MSKIDENYHTLLRKILQEGYNYDDPNRKGVKRKELLSYIFRHEFKDGFPAITTKKLAYKSVVTELLWFLRGDTNIKYLVDNGCNIWNKDAYNYYCKKCKEQGFMHNSFQGFLDMIKGTESSKLSKRIPSDYTLGDLGPVYGHQWVKWGSNNKKLSLVQPKPKLDPKYEPTYLGIASGKNKEGHFLSKTWEGMIARCYDENNISYPLYGGKGVYVCNKWLSFDGFLEDVQLLDNFDKKLKEPKNYVLDKDGKGNGFVYSLETCQWITSEENTNLISNVEYTVEKDGVQYTFTNISKFCKKHNIDGRNFSDLWTKNAKTRYGFKFISKKDLDKGINQIKRLIKNLKEKPTATDHIVNSWNVGDLSHMALPPCHYGFQVVVRPLTHKERISIFENIYTPNEENFYIYVDIRKDYNVKYEKKILDEYDIPKYGFELHWSQRSVDTFLGLPFNIASYATLALILEKITGYKALAIQGDLKKVHLYDNSFDAVKEQLNRDINKYNSCKLNGYITDYVNETKNLDEFISYLKPEDFELENYESYPGIKVEMLERDE